MDEAELYYTPPTDEVFNEVKKKCIIMWGSFDNEFGYVDEKVNRIKDIPNVGDNLMYMVAMFHVHLQRALSNHLSDEANEAIMLRLLDGGSDVQYIPFFPK